MRILLLVTVIFLSACSRRTTVAPGRGAEKEVGPMAIIHPSGEEPREDRHGVWRGMNGDQVVWEVRYVRGQPAGPYREWNDQGELVATWPYNWEGEIEGWVRFYQGGKPLEKFELNFIYPSFEFDPIGASEDFLNWWKTIPDGIVEYEK